MLGNAEAREERAVLHVIDEHVVDERVEVRQGVEHEIVRDGAGELRLLERHGDAERLMRPDADGNDTCLALGRRLLERLEHEKRRRVRTRHD